MLTYSQIAWLPLTAGLTLVGLLASFYVWRRRGAAAGLRGVAWSLLPLAAYLIGAIELLWRFGTAIGNFATSFVFSPRVWAGIIVVLVSVSLFAISGGLRGRSRGGGPAARRRQDGGCRRGPGPDGRGSRPPRRSARGRARAAAGKTTSWGMRRRSSAQASASRSG